jgi:hypothetical protein
MRVAAMWYSESGDLVSRAVRLAGSVAAGSEESRTAETLKRRRAKRNSREAPTLFIPGNVVARPVESKTG